jgi:hypothetical protein
MPIPRKQEQNGDEKALATSYEERGDFFPKPTAATSRVVVTRNKEQQSTAAVNTRNSSSQ